MSKKLQTAVKLNEAGKCIGDSHGRAKFSDLEVETMRRLREEGMLLIEIARRFGTTEGYVSKVCSYRIRASMVVRILSIAGK